VYTDIGNIALSQSKIFLCKQYEVKWLHYKNIQDKHFPQYPNSNFSHRFLILWKTTFATNIIPHVQHSSTLYPKQYTTNEGKNSQQHIE
jgi:hypothetical protein